MAKSDPSFKYSFWNFLIVLLTQEWARAHRVFHADLHSDEHFRIWFYIAVVSYVAVYHFIQCTLKWWNEKQIANIGNYYLNNKRATPCHRSKCAIKNATPIQIRIRILEPVNTNPTAYMAYSLCAMCANVYSLLSRKFNWCSIGWNMENIANEFEIHEITIKVTAANHSPCTKKKRESYRRHI